ncbi:DUF4912 domain-containing protein [Paenibacillus roseipurpureus]|uniref:DUF4912 domain-containing protein n=1 Tax=Paenibacillus roseopurpureus TaxID=2918901 RepID=A0AA96RJW8_9BACL|nr:DUF4912 domain-containing protein [Paenibacillus sp. MBLB1832]WNR43699.1 DUF4912 domain-containing protein [Paenibacillus sp. MBLB1832]
MLAWFSFVFPYALEKVSLISIQSPLFQIDRDTLHFLVRSPSTQFIYWQLSSSKQRLLKEHYDKDWRELSPALRFHTFSDDLDAENTDDPAIGSILELPLPQGESCFIGGLCPGRTYYASLGIHNEQGQFLPLLHSNTIETPTGDWRETSSAVGVVSPYIYLPATLVVKQRTPDAHAYFSAYSVYVPKPAYSLDTESGGDT